MFVRTYKLLYCSWWNENKTADMKDNNEELRKCHTANSAFQFLMAFSVTVQTRGDSMPGSILTM